jgi:N-acylneuraminate cytidylyltransferase
MVNNLSVLALIPARGGSKRVPRKNIKELAGKPLLFYTIEQAKKSKYIDRLIVSTDDKDVAQVARECGAEVPFMRPDELAGDEVTDFPVFLHSLEWLRDHERYQPDIVVQLRPTHPLRKAEDVDKAIEILIAHPEEDSVRTVKEPDQTPYKMYKICESGLLEALLPIFGVPESFNLPRQKLPKAYEHVGVADVMWTKTIVEKKEMSGKKIIPLVLDHYPYSGINTLEDWEKYEYWMGKNL